MVATGESQPSGTPIEVLTGMLAVAACEQAGMELAARQSVSEALGAILRHASDWAVDRKDPRGLLVRQFVDTLNTSIGRVDGSGA
ncbi:MAG: hypothetical protein AAB834_04620 [Patescibacteria group bacterium]